MRKDICNFVRRACAKYKLEAVYISKSDLYMITKKGRAVSGFTREQFYQIPRSFRMKEMALMLVGLNHNLGERHKDQVFHKRNIGKRIA